MGRRVVASTRGPALAVPAISINCNMITAFSNHAAVGSSFLSLTRDGVGCVRRC